MKIIRGSFSGQYAYFHKDIIDNWSLRVNKKLYSVSTNIPEVYLIEKEYSKKTFTLFLIVLLGITIIGLIFAIPLLMTHKTLKATVAVKLNDGICFVAECDKKEWEILSTIQKIKLPEGFVVN